MTGIFHVNQRYCRCGHYPVAAEAFEHTELTLLLLSGRFEPEPSPDLVRDKEMDVPVDRVSPWTVPALEYDASFFVTVVSLAGEFVYGGRVVSNLALRKDPGVAVWRVLPSISENLNQLQSLQESMPPLARALVTDDVATRAEETNSWGDVTDEEHRCGLADCLEVCSVAHIKS